MWELPLCEEYTREIQGKYADIKNIGEAGLAGTIAAGAFLKEFVDNTPWCHLDIAGTAWLEGQKKGSTGRPVPMLTEFILREAGLAK